MSNEGSGLGESPLFRSFRKELTPSRSCFPTTTIRYRTPVPHVCHWLCQCFFQWDVNSIPYWQSPWRPCASQPIHGPSTGPTHWRSQWHSMIFSLCDSGIQ